MIEINDLYAFEELGIHSFEESTEYVCLKYIGLTDKKGMQLCEGDILKLDNAQYRLYRETGWEGKEDGIYQIYWDESTSAFHASDDEILDHGIYIWLVAKYSEKIGNIYENKELLK